MSNLKQDKRKNPSSDKKDKDSSKKEKGVPDLSGLFDDSEVLAKGKALAKKYKQKPGE